MKISPRGKFWTSASVMALVLSVAQARPIGAVPETQGTMPQIRPTEPIIVLESPVPNSVLLGAFEIRGWALDPNTTAEETGVREVRVYRGDMDTGLLLGIADYGLYREDVARIMREERFAASGFSLPLNSSSLVQGQNLITVYANVRSGWISRGIVVESAGAGCGRPAPPMNFQATTVQNASATAFWQPPPYVPAYYNIYHATDGSYFRRIMTDIPPTTLRTVVSDLRSGYMYVTAVDSFGRESQPSNVVWTYSGSSGQFLPMVLTATSIGGGQVYLVWTTVQASRGYNVHRSGGGEPDTIVMGTSGNTTATDTVPFQGLFTYVIGSMGVGGSEVFFSNRVTLEAC